MTAFSKFCESFYQIIKPEAGVGGLSNLQLKSELKVSLWDTSLILQVWKLNQKLEAEKTFTLFKEQ